MLDVKEDEEEQKQTRKEEGGAQERRGERKGASDNNFDRSVFSHVSKIIPNIHPFERSL